MINPAIRLIFLLFFVKNPIIDLFHFDETAENINKGTLMPIPKKIKLKRFVTALIVVVVNANKTIREAGLHGITIAPKNNPKINALSNGFFFSGALTFGKNLPKSKSKIKNRLTIARIAKAIGEIIPIAFVNEACRNFVNIKPTRNIENITPRATINPKNITVFFDSLSDTWVDKNAKNPGYKGITQTAASGANNPAEKDIPKFTKTLTILI